MNSTYPLRGKVAIVGLGITEQGRLPDRTATENAVDAALLAIADAGLHKDQIDGLITTSSVMAYHPRHHLNIADRLGLLPRHYNELSAMGACAAGYLRHAVSAISSGMADYVLLVGGDNMLTFAGRTAALQAMMNIHDKEFVEPYGNIPVSNFALVTRRNMYEFGWTSEQLAEVAVTMRLHASRSPGAVMTEPITVDDVLDSRMISDPFHLLECALVTDGGLALVLTSAERAQELPHPPIYVLGEAGTFTSYYTPGFPDLVDHPRKLIGDTASTAMERAGITHDDVDIIGLPDMFTGIVPIVLEASGFCQRGDGGPFAASGAIRYDGRYPVNTHGGNHSFSHLGDAGQLLNAWELARQLRGDQGERQVPNAKVGFLYSFGGTFAQHASVILSSSLD